MKIVNMNVIYDDNAMQCFEGDKVLLQTAEMDDIVPATIEKIMTNMVSFIIDDQIIGYIPKKVRVKDIISITLYQKKRK